MSTSMQRKKPGYTKSGQVRIVSLNYQELADLETKTNKKKVQAKIQNRMRILAGRPGFVNPVPAVESTAEVATEANNE